MAESHQATGFEWEQIVTPVFAGDAPYSPPGSNLASLQQHRVRVLYLIPFDRDQRPKAVETLKAVVVQVRAYLREEMRLNGFGPKTFQFEEDPLQPDTPLIHIYKEANPVRTAAWFRQSLDNFKISASQAGYFPLAGIMRGEVWLVVCDSHVLTGNGQAQTLNFAGPAPQLGSWGGFAHVTCFHSMLAVDGHALLADNRDLRNVEVLLGDLIGPYDPPPGPYSLSPQESLFEQYFVAEVASIGFGVVAHELVHAFGPAHDRKMENNASGSLMGLGFRGLGAWVNPTYLPSASTRLGYATAQRLNISRFFEADQAYADNTPPTVNVLTAGVVYQEEDGLLRITAEASDAHSGLALANIRGHDIRRDPISVSDCIELDGNDARFTFEVYDYLPDETIMMVVDVIDNAGNQTSVNVPLYIFTNKRMPPHPALRAMKTTYLPDETIELTAEESFDWVFRDASSSYVVRHDTELLFQWDLDGDGLFEVDTGPIRTVSTSFTRPGTHRLRVKTTDGDGMSAVSPIVAVRVVNLQATVRTWLYYE